jgi:hypothetical protein
MGVYFSTSRRRVRDARVVATAAAAGGGGGDADSAGPAMVSPFTKASVHRQVGEPHNKGAVAAAAPQQVRLLGLWGRHAAHVRGCCVACTPTRAAH